MTASSISSQDVRDVLAPFGALQAQPEAAWQGDRPLHPSLARFYEEVGPYGKDRPRGPEGIEIPTLGNPFWLPPLSGLWAFQEGYRWQGRDGEPVAGWNQAWLVVGDQGGDPFILDEESGHILHDHHGRGSWAPVHLCDDIFALGFVLGTIGVLHEEAGDDLYDEDFEIRPEWSGELRARLGHRFEAAEADAIAARLEW
ncbi:hypothetical protein ACSBM8_14690 [Sphingomonas sp. ASY06-1R]|uniref:hypothetical protein n=1 Tax=Sphingomonas sp. ASY06-1R TaxID=3445771 RepID=UPI003FA245AD